MLARSAGFAVLGYVFGKLGCEAAPFLLGFVLGPLMEDNLRRSMAISFGSPSVFVERPISLALLLASLLAAPAARPGPEAKPPPGRSLSTRAARAVRRLIEKPEPKMS